MTIKLELLEIVWLQNINRQPGYYKIRHNNGQIATLAECNLIELDIHGDWYITTRGKEVLKRHLPYSYSYLNETFMSQIPPQGFNK